MVDSIFHSLIDIHGGGSDLVFPHHENEIAQAEASRHHRLARYWLHNGRLNIDGAEMHKSEGNALFVKDLPGDKRAFRLFLLSTHYRSPINFRYDSLQVVETEWKKLEKTVKSLYRTSELSHDLTPVSGQHKAMIDGYREKFNDAMDLDFNTPNAITALLGLVKQGNLFLKHPVSAPTLQLTVSTIQSLLEILGTPVSIKPLQPDEAALIAEWNECRAKKDFAKADLLRKELQKRDLL
jgi:cysteinyl-tRNA synthetase